MITAEKERNIYQLIAIGCFVAFIAIGWKYKNLRIAYRDAETQKVEFCHQVGDLKCDLSNLERDLVNAINESERAHDELIECLDNTN